MVVLACRPTAESPISGVVFAMMKTTAAASASASGTSIGSLAWLAESVAAARTTRLRPGLELGKVLQQITFRASDDFPGVSHCAVRGYSLGPSATSWPVCDRSTGGRAKMAVIAFD
jgi:hypothetical protein